MTKKFFLAFASVSVAALLLPLAASAAVNFNDVTLSANTSNLSVGGVTVSIASGGATIASTTVDTSTFTVLFGPGSSIAMSAPTLSHTAAAAWVTQDSCSGGQQTLTIAAPSDAATTSVVVTPSSANCSSGVGGSPSPSPAPPASSGGGGGGAATPTPMPIPTPTPTPTPAATPSTVASAASADLLALVAQLKSLISLFESLGGVVAPETKALLAAFPTPRANFTRNLEIGMTGDDVKALQVWLNGHGYQVAASGAGSPGNETTLFGRATKAALIRFQKAKGITPAAGYFGPKTRAVVNAM